MNPFHLWFFVYSLAGASLLTIAFMSQRLTLSKVDSIIVVHGDTDKMMAYTP